VVALIADGIATKRHGNAAVPPGEVMREINYGHIAGNKMLLRKIERV
jgi:hypothetical protein